MVPSAVPGTIHLSFDDQLRLFHSFDPAPLSGRHLEATIERFIVHSATEQRAPHYRLIAHTAEQLSNDEQLVLATALKEHFAHRWREENATIEAQVKSGAQALLIGSAFLFICGLTGLAASTFLPKAIGLFVEQGLLVIGWVALWRPVDLFLYELRPLRKQREVLKALKSMDVKFEISGMRGAPLKKEAIWSGSH